jgi:hypothetical protein
MKKILLSIIIGLSFSSLHAQSRLNMGGGYFGQTITHPGIVFEIEYETNVSTNMSLPLRLDLGFYHHPRNHDGLFFDVNYGLRRYFKSGLFLEESIGIGVLGSAINTNVFSVDHNGIVSEGSKLNPLQFMPSLTLGIGYNLSNKNKESLNLIWLRPKILWQYPHKTTASFSPAIQIGFTHQIMRKYKD